MVYDVLNELQVIFEETIIYLLGAMHYVGEHLIALGLHYIIILYMRSLELVANDFVRCYSSEEYEVIVFHLLDVFPALSVEIRASWQSLCGITLCYVIFDVFNALQLIFVLATLMRSMSRVLRLGTCPVLCWRRKRQLAALLHRLSGRTATHYQLPVWIALSEAPSSHGTRE